MKKIAAVLILVTMLSVLSLTTGFAQAIGESVINVSHPQDIEKQSSIEDNPDLTLPTFEILSTYEVGFSDFGGDSFFDITLAGVGSGYDLRDGIPYIGWCIDPYSGPPPNGGETWGVNAYSSYDPSMPTDVKHYLGTEIPWPKINWILNNKNGHGNNVINPAIWYLITGQRTNWNQQGWDCPVGSACDQLVLAADGDFVPNPGQVIAVILRKNGIGGIGVNGTSTYNDGFQDTIIEVVLPPGDVPAIDVQKTADPTSIPEPGGAVTFTVVVTNNSSPTDPVTITSLVDDIHGDLDGQGTCSIPQTIQPGANYTCEFPATVSGNAGYSETDTVTASGTDDEGTPVSDFDDATVVITPLDPVIDVVKTANPTSITEPGGAVTFTVVVENNSGPTDPVTITSLVDDIHGNLNGQGTCSVPQTIQPGANYTCEFPATVSGDAGYSETDTVTASGTDDEGTPVSDFDDATVVITPLDPVIDVVKTADPTTIPEPGGTVTFTVVIYNNSGPTDPVTIDTLVDDIHGNLNGQGTCSVPQTIQPGGSYTCAFTATVSGSAGDSETDTVTASGYDDEETPVSDSDDATVTITGEGDGLPEIDVQKNADPVFVYEPGGMVTFTVEVTNNSGPTDPVTITSLVDDIHGNLNGQGTCSVPQTIQPGDTYTCEFTAMVQGSAGDSETDTVTASGTDDEGNPVSDSDDATVEVRGALYKVYFPNADNEKSIISRVPMTVGYEDLQFDRPDMDFDYNDWVTNIDTKLVINDQTQDLYRIDFTVTPRARGGVRSHAFHINIPANTFATDGTANLTIKDQFGNIVSSTSTPFDASQANDFNVIPCTCEAFPVQGQIINAIEGTPVMPTQRTAVLSIEFYTPGPFDQSYLDEDQISKPHGTGLFFDPYIDVIDFGFEVHQGDLRLLSVPEITWMWPEERVRIDEAYPLVTGSPPNFNFPNGWWKNHNTCVYGDGIPCPTALFEYMTAE